VQRGDRILFPESGFTLADALDYYKRVSKWLLPHLRNRPLSFKRYPDTIRGESFWEKDAPSFTPAWVKTVAVPRRSGESDIRYIVVNTQRALAWAVESGAIELHPFLHHATDRERATSVVFDLDPGEKADIVDCCAVAVRLRDALQNIDLKSFAKVSGSKGLQVYVPLNSDVTHATTEPFARLVAEELAREFPREIVAKMAKQFRARKVFIDWSQNADYKTTVSVYSLRAKRERPYVSMPLTWAEVEEADREALDFAPDDAIGRLQSRGDLFAPVLKLRQTIPAIGRGAAQAARTDAREEKEIVVNGVRLPKARSQSGRRLFLVTKTESGNELWLDMRGKFKRWILRPDREGGGQLIAMPAGDFAIDPAYYAAKVPAEWKHRVSIEDAGSYEVIDGSDQRRYFALWFTGRVLAGEWTLEKIGGEEHRSWRLAPVRTR
jgi:bifunctional non-homologous end joining protein LigD